MQLPRSGASADRSATGPGTARVGRRCGDRGTWDRHRCREGNYRGDVELSSLIDTLSSHPGPVLTWYGKDRTELGGPVAARWLAKTANLLGGDLSGDLFEDGPALDASDPRSAGGGRGWPEGVGRPSPTGTIRLDLGASWQSVIWLSAAWLSGWNSVTEGVVGVDKSTSMSVARVPPVDVWVTDRLRSEHLSAAAEGSWVLAQATSPMELSWPGPVPEGVLDALTELAAQSDTLQTVPAVGPETTVLAAEADASEAHTMNLRDLDRFQGPDAATSAERNPRRVLMTSVSPTVDARSILFQWTAGRSVVLVDPRFHDALETERVAASERATPLV